MNLLVLRSKEEKPSTHRQALDACSLDQLLILVLLVGRENADFALCGRVQTVWQAAT